MNTGLVLTVIAFVFVAFALLTGKVPPSIACGTSMVFLWISGVVTEQEVFANFVSSNIIVMIGMMVVIAALLKTSILSHIAGLILKARGNSVQLVLLAGMIIPFFLCQFIGGVTSMITVLPLLIALANEIGISPTVVVLPASVGAQAGLLALPIGGGAVQYLLTNQIAENVGAPGEMGFWDLCLTRMPGTVAVMAFVVLIGYKLLPKRDLGSAEALETRPDVLKKSELPRWKEAAAYAIFLGSLGLMFVSRSLGISMSLISTAAALLCVLLGILDEKEMFRSINWSLIFMMGFMLAMSTALNNSGAGELIAGALGGVFGIRNTFVVCGIVFLICAALTQVMDNGALINIFSPIIYIACIQNNISALPVICALQASCLVSFTSPLASPSALMAYNLGGYSLKEMMKFSVPLVLISAVISIIWIPIYFTL